MSIVGAFDVHRRQLTFEYLDTVTGELKRGRVAPAGREHLRQWLARFAGHGDAHFALEGCTGWRYVIEELLAAGIGPHLAEPADTAALRGRKRHARTDKADARHLRVHLLAGDLPGCWIPPGHVLEARAVVRLYKDLLGERGAWHQRIAATLFRQGVPAIGTMARPEGRAAVAAVVMSAAGRQAVETGLRQAGRLTAELEPLRRQLDMISRRQPGCAALRATQFGVGAVTSVAIWAGLGDVRRFPSSSDVVRHTGLDITVYSSDTKRSAGHLSRQGPQLLRWALYESAKCAARPAAPGHGHYTATRDRRTARLATLPVARKLARRCYHTLRELGEEALAPAA
jgi:transposase